jgi:copper chaperone CopZ
LDAGKMSAANNAADYADAASSYPALLAGKLRNETGDCLAPTHTTRKGTQHLYYVSNRLLTGGVADPAGWRLPTPALEQIVACVVAEHLHAAAQRHTPLTQPGAVTAPTVAAALVQAIGGDDRAGLRDPIASGQLTASGSRRGPPRSGPSRQRTGVSTPPAAPKDAATAPMSEQIKVPIMAGSSAIGRKRKPARILLTLPRWEAPSHGADILTQEKTMIRFQVPDMHCGGCVRRVTRAVQSVDPAATVEADVPGREVRVEGSADPAALMAALAEAGYPATPASSTAP